MNEHPRNDELHDLVSGTLPEERAMPVRRHVDSCEACREEVEAASALVASLRSLPLEIRPERDLRAGIWRRIDEADDGLQATSRATEMPARSGISPARWSLAAAALVLVAVTAAASIAIGTLRGTADQPVDPAVPALRVAEARYDAASSELQALLDEQRALLAPATREVLERSLAAIDAAVDETRAALSDDPGNAMLARMLMTSYDRKLDILRAASQAPG
jgi:hypothetical protein